MAGRIFMDMPSTLIGIVILFDEAFKYEDGAKCAVYVGTNGEKLCAEFCSVIS
jgi:hypothetical protein